MKTNFKLQGTPNSPVIIFSNSLGADLCMWDDLVPYLLPYFRVLQYDTRGLGKSEVTPGPYTIKLLAQDVMDLMDHLKIEKAFFCGLSMGGLIGQYLGIHHPDKITKIILSNTAAKIGDEERWNGRIKTVTESGLAIISDDMMDRWFTPSFRLSRPDRVSEIKDIFIHSDPVGYCNNCVAVRDADFTSLLHSISNPTLIITGNDDPVTTVEHAEFLHLKISGSSLVVLNAKHLSATELSQEYAETLINFLVGSSTHEKGMHIRRTVLGDIHVENSLKHINAFNSDFQHFITPYAWGEIWSRPGLTKPQRSMITLAILIASTRKAELKMHLKAACNNGLRVEEIKEVILHASLYCGLPAANEAMHTAEELFDELNLDYK